MSGRNLATALYMYNICTAVQGTTQQLYSWRCATHIHMNLLDLPIHQMATLGLISFVSDNYFYAMGAEARRDNYNCRPVSLLATSAETIGDICREARTDNGVGLMDVLIGRNRRDERYCGMNWHALPTFGTLEVRHFPGTNDMDLIVSWIEACAAMYQAAQNIEFDDFVAMVHNGPSTFGPAVFGDNWENMSYAESEQDWAHVRHGFEHLMAVAEAPEGGTLDAVLRQHKVIN
jgi:hypothetical protein